MSAIRKFDLKAIVACVIVFGIVQGLLFGEIIGPFWELEHYPYLHQHYSCSQPEPD